jgi:hypothetical protein
LDKKEDLNKKLEIVVDDEVATGAYANLAFINHSPDEFTLDFIYVPPSSPKAKLRARIISNPAHTKRFLMALQENVRRFEEKFGEINVGTAHPEKFINGAGHA